MSRWRRSGRRAASAVLSTPFLFEHPVWGELETLVTFSVTDDDDVDAILSVVVDDKGTDRHGLEFDVDYAPLAEQLRSDAFINRAADRIAEDRDEVADVFDDLEHDMRREE